MSSIVGQSTNAKGSTCTGLLYVRSGRIDHERALSFHDGNIGMYVSTDGQQPRSAMCKSREIVFETGHVQSDQLSPGMHNRCCVVSEMER